MINYVALFQPRLRESDVIYQKKSCSNLQGRKVGRRISDGVFVVVLNWKLICC